MTHGQFEYYVSLTNLISLMQATNHTNISHLFEQLSHFRHNEDITFNIKRCLILEVQNV